MQHQHLLLIYHEQNDIYVAINQHGGRPYGFSVLPGIPLILNSRKETNKIITNISEQWIKQLKIYKPNKIEHHFKNITTTDYTPFTHFVNKIRRFFKLPEKY